MNRARSIKQNADGDVLPDFRRIGTVLRIVLMVNAAMLLALLAQVGTISEWLSKALRASAFVQPVLLSLLLLYYLLNDALSRLPYRQGAALVMAIAALVAMGIDALGGELFLAPGALGGVRGWREAVVSAGMAAMLLAYFRLRVQALSPARDIARLQALQARIRPHFLFNSINAVLGIVRSDPKRAETALEDMADLFRMAMSADAELVPLRKEVELARQYLALEQLRLGERLRVEWRIAETLQDALIPPLILQPLLENAVYHGIEPLAAGGTISIEIRREGKELQLIMSNPVHFQSQPRRGNRMALSNIRERLALQFDVEASYRVETAQGCYRVQIQIPYLREETA